MGEVVVFGFGVVALLGIALVTAGVLKRSRRVTQSGIGLLAAVAGAWIFGPPGLVLGIFAVVPLRRVRSGGSK